MFFGHHPLKFSIYYSHIFDWALPEFLQGVGNAGGQARYPVM
jgi:hypothetical protein